MKIGLFGGSFDPIHRGHVEPVQRAVGQLGLYRVLYLPTAVPPHKRGREFAPALARYAMTELALLDEARLEVSVHELTLGRPAYTADTVEHFAARMPGAALHLLLGADSFRDFGTWVRWLDMLRHVRTKTTSRKLPKKLRSDFCDRRRNIEWDSLLPINDSCQRRAPHFKTSSLWCRGQSSLNARATSFRKSIRGAV